MVDTGAFQNFMDLLAAKLAGCHVVLDNTLGTVMCAGNQEMPIIGWTICSVKLGSYMADVRFLVVEKLINEAGVILGQPWQEENDVHICCRKRTINIRAHGKRCEIYPLGASPAVKQPGQGADERILAALAGSMRSPQAALTLCSPKQAAKLLRATGTDYYMVNVRHMPSASSNPLQANSLRSPDGTLGAIQIGGNTRPHLPDERLDAEVRTFLAPDLDSGIPSISSERDV
jgi:hypothetical protein